MTRRLLLASLLLVLAAVSVPPPAPGAPRMPTQRQWEADVREATAGSLSYLKRRARFARARGVPVRRLAVNLDIDNTVLASFYDHGAPVRPVLRIARTADDLGMRVFFNSHRARRTWRTTYRALRRAGFPVDRLCLARRGEALQHSKRRCRAGFTADGFRLVVNVGNRRTDLVGGGYDRAYRLPDYGGRLG